MPADGHELPMALRAAYKAMHRKTDSITSQYGVTADQYVLLRILAWESGVTQETLVVRAFSDPNTVRRMLMLLERSGFVTRPRHPTDERARCVSLTRKGRETHGRLQRVLEPFRAALVSDYSPKELQTLQELLGRIPSVVAAHVARRAPSRSRAASKNRRGSRPAGTTNQRQALGLTINPRAGRRRTG